jgi:EmrB/QacA subfamily drug resistance transporter
VTHAHLVRAGAGEMGDDCRSAAPLPGRTLLGMTHRRLVLAGLMLGVSLAALDMTIVATAARTIADDLGGLSLQAWATTAYLIAGAVATPLYGRLSDVHGRKPLYLLAIALFVLGSAACAFAGSMYQLAVLRAVQGLGAGGLFSLSITIVADLVPPRERARYTGHLIAVYGLFGVLGPLVGGLLAGADEILGITGWRWVFLVNVPVGILALLVVGFVLTPSPRGPRAPVDWIGASALAVGVVPLLVVAEEGRTWGWTSASAVGAIGIGILGIAAFVLVERRMGEHALLPLRHFRLPAFRLGSVVGIVVGAAMFGAITVIPLYLQIVEGRTPAQAGVLMLPLVAGIVLTTGVSGRVIERTGRYRSWAVLGCGFLVLGFVWLSTTAPDSPFAVTAVCMAVFGVGIGANLQSLTLAVQDALPESESGVATASTAFARQLGGSAGAAVFLSVLFGLLPGRIAAAFTTAAPQLAPLLADPANAQAVAALQGASLEDSSFLSTVDPALARPFLDGFAGATGVVFALGAVVAVIGLAAAVGLPDKKIGAAR